MDDDFDVDDEFLAALAASEPSSSRPSGRPQQPQPQRIQQPTPQRLDRAPPSNSPSNSSGPKIVQPTPQVLPTRSSGSSILVSPRQKGNPVLACLKSVAWEYSDIPADYGLGLTTCALFLSLKYHRLHPEYIYTRIRNLQGKYNLRILLTMVDIPNHEDSLRELAKTSLANNVTVMLCWSATEAAHYLELYKSYEHAGFAAIRGQQATGYAEKLVEFVTVPRQINKADAVALVSTFGSLRHAVNADPEQVSVISGWGEKKVKAWCKVVEEPFRVKKAAKRRAPNRTDGQTSRTNVLEGAVPIGSVSARDLASRRAAGMQNITRQPRNTAAPDPEADDEDEDAGAMIAAASSGPNRQTSPKAARPAASSRDEQLSGGIAAALARLRESG
ncbi:restriction endonuclease type II-like protein [Lasiosphaeria hispida]|uniref:Restriction endonuclease type II-like protein n=1 Tax=Lasiosphaeria hispida TaxID=260671 RepID=A0AAJ0HFQ0_9PEZI|nr:restriction endonuclease type II-like protein [Lasiosphaeria hispida]